MSKLQELKELPKLPEQPPSELPKLSEQPTFDDGLNKWGIEVSVDDASDESGIDVDDASDESEIEASELIDEVLADEEVAAQTQGSTQPQEQPFDDDLNTIDAKDLHYKEDKPLGKGLTAQVFPVEYHQKPAAFKRYKFSPELSEDERKEQEAIILDEATVMNCLHDISIVAFRGICKNPWGIVMELCEGGELQKRLEWGSRYGLRDQLRWAAQISYAVHYLHTMDILHRDLKSSNIYLDKFGNAKLGDFGFSAKRFSNILSGTLDWLAPELVTQEGLSNTKATDVFSLGMVLWEIMRGDGEEPYESMSVEDAIKEIKGSGKKIQESWPPVFKNLIQACWNRTADARPTAERVGDELSAALRSTYKISIFTGKSWEELVLKNQLNRAEKAEAKKQEADETKGEAEATQSAATLIAKQKSARFSLSSNNALTLMFSNSNTSSVPQGEVKPGETEATRVIAAKAQAEQPAVLSVSSSQTLIPPPKVPFEMDAHPTPKSNPMSCCPVL